MQLDRQRIFFIRLTDRKAAASCRIIKAAHVPADGNRLGGLEPQKALNQKD